MIVKLNKEKDLTEDVIDIKYRTMNSTISKIATIAGYGQPYIMVKHNDTTHQVDISDILYIDTVDKKYFIYTEQDIYETHSSLIALEEMLGEHGFMRVSRSLVVNVYRIKEIKADRNMKIRAYLETGEAVTITRHYRKAFFNKIKEFSLQKGEIEG